NNKKKTRKKSIVKKALIFQSFLRQMMWLFITPSSAQVFNNSKIKYLQAFTILTCQSLKNKLDQERIDQKQFNIFSHKQYDQNYNYDIYINIQNSIQTLNLERLKSSIQ
ncbi:hypothetical protein TTHERM_001128529, partial (macronuclear) [Tetrahymena thermophila SB210]